MPVVAVADEAPGAEFVMDALASAYQSQTLDTYLSNVDKVIAFLSGLPYPGYYQPASNDCSATVPTAAQNVSPVPQPNPTHSADDEAGAAVQSIKYWSNFFWRKE